MTEIEITSDMVDRAMSQVAEWPDASAYLDRDMVEDILRAALGDVIERTAEQTAGSLSRKAL